MPDGIILDEDMLMISVPPNEPVDLVDKHLGPGPHPGTGTDQQVHAGGGRAIKVPKLEFKQDYLDFIEENFMEGSENPLGTLLMAEEENPEDEHLVLEDYHEIASAFAEIKARFPDLRLSRIDESRQAFLNAAQEHANLFTEISPEDVEGFLLWYFIPGEGMGSNYDHHSYEVTINSKDRAVFLQDHIDIMEKQLSEALEVEERYRIKDQMELITERIAMAKDPDRLKEAHSAYWEENEDDQFRATMFHEFGHVLHRKYNAEWGIFFEDVNIDDYTWAAPVHEVQKEDYGVTARAKDSRPESVAENFALWMMGHEDVIHPKMAEMFEGISKRHGG